MDKAPGSSPVTIGNSSFEKIFFLNLTNPTRLQSAKYWYFVASENIQIRGNINIKHCLINAVSLNLSQSQDWCLKNELIIMRPKKHGFKVRPFTLFPTRIIRRLIFVVELIVRLLTYLSKTIKDSETRLLRNCNISNETHSKNQIICFRRFSDGWEKENWNQNKQKDDW